MIALATLFGAGIAALLCRLGHRLGARNDVPLNALRVTGATLLFAMAASATAEGMWLGVVAATLAATFTALGGIDIVRHELDDSAGATLVAVPHERVRDGDTMEMPVVVRDAA